MCPAPSISVVVTTFQRRHLVGTAIRSALGLVDGTDGETVIVDDASSDGTIDMLSQTFADDLSAGRLRLVQHEQNRGVTAAKNSGYKAARGDWVLFLDSDDALLTGSAKQILGVLASSSAIPVVFFRCVDQTGALVGLAFDQPQTLPLRRYLQHVSYGEALVVVNKRLVGEQAEGPFDADLRGYEGLGCSRIIKQYGPALLSNVAARRYNRSGRDRLSSGRALLRRLDLVGKGHLRLIGTFRTEIPLGRAISLFVKALAYIMVGKMTRVLEKSRG